jgi:hypothetical protein
MAPGRRIRFRVAHGVPGTLLVLHHRRPHGAPVQAIDDVG